jgi:hypothetical protein
LSKTFSLIFDNKVQLGFLKIPGLTKFGIPGLKEKNPGIKVQGNFAVTDLETNQKSMKFSAFTLTCCVHSNQVFEQSFSDFGNQKIIKWVLKLFFMVKIQKISVTIPNSGSRQFFRDQDCSGIPRDFGIPFEKP